MRNPCADPEPRRLLSLIAGALFSLALLAAPAHSVFAQAGWPGYGNDSHHSTISHTAVSPLQSILWQTPVDQHPPYNNGELFIHYGTPLITAHNTVIVTVQTSSDSSNETFQIEGHDGYNGTLKWIFQTDYQLPQHDWIPSCACTLSPSGALYVPGAGGTVWKVVGVDTTTVTATRQAFYDVTQYNAANYANVRINTPITCDKKGDLFYGVFDTSSPAVTGSGLARIDSTGNGTFVPVTEMAHDNSMTKIAHNCAPALSQDESIVYVAVSNGNGYGSASGYLTSVNSTTLGPINHVFLTDPGSLQPANVIDDGTSTPLVGPDGDVYYGVLDYPWYSNIDRGWMLHFTPSLRKVGVPGRFGWDDTASVVPATAVPSYTGKSKYLILTKYNNYADTGGDGMNKVAILDPHDSEANNVTTGTNTLVMKEVISVLGVTQNSGLPGVREWCINSAAIDPITKCAVINSEDGNCYRWDFTSNTLSQTVQLTAATGEAYTPTIVGPDGTAYAINNAILFALGPNVVNVTSRCTVSLGKLTLNRTTGQYSQTATITNVGAGALNGTVSLALDKLTSTVTLVNATGTTANAKPVGSPYITVTTGGLANGASAQVTLQFTNPSAKGISFKSRVLAGTGTP
jgi:hypothetical protein